MINGVEVKKGVTLSNIEWLTDKGFVRTSKGRNYFDNGVGESWQLLSGDEIRIEYKIYDKGRIDILIHFDKKYNSKYESIKSSISKSKKGSIYEDCNYYSKIAKEYHLGGSNYVNFIRGIVSTEINGGFQLGTIYLSNYSRKNECN